MAPPDDRVGTTRRTPPASDGRICRQTRLRKGLHRGAGARPRSDWSDWGDAAGHGLGIAGGYWHGVASTGKAGRQIPSPPWPSGNEFVTWLGPSPTERSRGGLHGITTNSRGTTSVTRSRNDSSRRSDPPGRSLRREEPRHDQDL